MLLTHRQIVLLIILTLCWGANWPVMKLALTEITPLYYRVITMGGGALIMGSYLLYKGYSLQLSQRDFIKIACLTLPNIIGWHIFSIFGVAELASGRASILAFTMPIWTVLLGAIILKQRLSARLWMSVVVVALAIGLLTSNEWTHLSGRPMGIIWMQMAAISWALGIVLFKKIKPQTPTEVTTVWMLALGAIIVGLVAAYYEPAPTWGTYSSTAWITIFYGLIINFVIGQLIWFSMVNTLPPAASSFSVMSVPLVSLLSGMIIMHEIPQRADLIAVVCIVFAIANTVFVKK
ncbi:MAG: DMT family transporter [Saezia sp.]